MENAQKVGDSDAFELPSKHRALWWIADDQVELDDWKIKFSKNGCVIHKEDPHPSPSNQISVIFSLDPATAEAALGYVPDESEWLEK